MEVSVSVSRSDVSQVISKMIDLADCIQRPVRVSVDNVHVIVEPGDKLEFVREAYSKQLAQVCVFKEAQGGSLQAHTR